MDPSQQWGAPPGYPQMMHQQHMQMQMPPMGYGMPQMGQMQMAPPMDPHMGMSFGQPPGMGTMPSMDYGMPQQAQAPAPQPQFQGHPGMHMGGQMPMDGQMGAPPMMGGPPAPAPVAGSVPSWLQNAPPPQDLGPPSYPPQAMPGHEAMGHPGAPPASKAAMPPQSGAQSDAIGSAWGESLGAPPAGAPPPGVPGGLPPPPGAPGGLPPPPGPPPAAPGPPPGDTDFGGPMKHREARLAKQRAKEAAQGSRSPSRRKKRSRSRRRRSPSRRKARSPSRRKNRSGSRRKPRDRSDKRRRDRSGSRPKKDANANAENGKKTDEFGRAINADAEKQPAADKPAANTAEAQPGAAPAPALLGPDGQPLPGQQPTQTPPVADGQGPPGQFDPAVEQKRDRSGSRKRRSPSRRRSRKRSRSRKRRSPSRRRRSPSRRRDRERRRSPSRRRRSPSRRGGRDDNWGGDVRDRNGGGGGGAAWGGDVRDRGDNSWGGGGGGGDRDRFGAGDLPPPPKPQADLCGDFRRGDCSRGDKCRFSHESADGGGGKGGDKGKGDKGKGDKGKGGKARDMCGDFKRGNCTRGDGCRFSHSEDAGGGGIPPGDWECPKCHVNVFASKNECFKCGATKDDSGGGGGGGKDKGGKGKGGKNPDWDCPKCGMSVFGSKDECFKCHVRKDGSKGKGKGGGPHDAPAPERFSEAQWEKPRTENGLQTLGEIAPQGMEWSYVLNDESRRSFAAYLSCPFTKEQTGQFFEQSKEGTDWQQPEGAHGPIPRKTAWMVDRSGCNCMYRYGSIEVPPQIYPQWMMEVMTLIMPMCGLSDPRMWPNCCNMNLYEDGGMSVGWHSDDEALFQGKFNDIRIISLSLGVRRKFELRANWPDKGEMAVRTMMLGDGDLCTMEGMTQKHFQHRVPKEGNVNGPRINLTWRWNVKHTPKCPVGRKR